MSDSPAVASTYADGFTCFITVEGIDVIKREDGTETRARLSTLSAPSRSTIRTAQPPYIPVWSAIIQ